MGEEEIINLWKQGYSVDQIVAKHPKKRMLDKEEVDDWCIRHRIETVILKFQKGE